MGEEIRLYSLSFGWLCSQEGGRGWWGATPGHTAGRLSEQGLSATGLEKVGVLSYLAYCLLFRRYFHQVKKKTAFRKQECICYNLTLFGSVLVAYNF